MSKISFGSKLHFIFIFNLVKERGERKSLYSDSRKRESSLTSISAMKKIDLGFNSFI
jgi:hypothetical protein